MTQKKTYVVETPEGLAYEFDAEEVHDVVVHDSGVLTVESHVDGAGGRSFAPGAWTRWFLTTDDGQEAS